MVINGFRTALADRLVECQAVRFSVCNVSPVDFNLQTLTREVAATVGETLFQLALHHEVDFQCVASMAPAGEALAKAFVRASPQHPSIIQVAKKMEVGNRSMGRVERGEVQGKRVLLLDDVMMQADPKLEAARAIEAGGGAVAGFLVLIDREQGGRQLVEEEGYRVLSVFTLAELLAHYVARRFISPAGAEEAMAYARKHV